MNATDPGPGNGTRTCLWCDGRPATTFYDSFCDACEPDARHALENIPIHVPHPYAGGERQSEFEGAVHAVRTAWNTATTACHVCGEKTCLACESCKRSTCRGDLLSITLNYEDDDGNPMSYPWIMVACRVCHESAEDRLRNDETCDEFTEYVSHVAFSEKVGGLDARP